MKNPPPDIQQLYTQALQYEGAGDIYHAIKIYKKIIRRAPEWSEPHARLGEIYKRRQEWKAALHYFKRTIALNPADQNGWWNVGIAATAMKKRRLTKNIWAKFGLDSQSPAPVCIRLQYERRFEIVLVKSIDPALGRIINIPNPASDRRYRDVVLYDRLPVGEVVVRNRRIPVFDELGLFKRSPFQTFSCLLHTSDVKDIHTLEKLCREMHLGFEVWSNSTRVMIPKGQLTNPEYYGNDWLPTPERGVVLVALAALSEAEIFHVLENWQLVTLCRYSDLERRM